jgi:hypothetical protein
VVRLGVTSGHVGAGRLPVSVDKRRQRWLGLGESSPLAMAGTMEQKVTKETKNTRVGTRSKIQYVAIKSDAHRLKLACFLPFVAFVTFCSRYFHARPESEDLRVTRRPAFRFRVLPSLPWSMLFNDCLGDATTVEQVQRLGRALTPKSNPNVSSSNCFQILPFFRAFRVFRG